MTATFWTGSSLSFTNGSKTVTVNTGPSLDSVKANSSLTAGNYNEPVEVKSVSGNTITLYNNWPGSTGTTSATIKPSAAAAASAGVAAQQLITEIQGLVGGASATATANSFVKRDSSGRIKAASPSANEDVVNKGYLGTAATATVTTSPSDTTVGRLLKVGDFGLGFISLAGDIPDTEAINVNRFGRITAESSGSKPFSANYNVLNMASSSATNTTIATSWTGTGGVPQMWLRSQASTYSDWVQMYHTGNTNFNEFGGAGVGDIVCPSLGYASTSTSIVFTLPINSKTVATGITTTGTFRLYNVRTGTYEETGLTARFNGGWVSSNRVVFIDFIGLTGKTVGDLYLLASDTTQASKITVNF